MLNILGIKKQLRKIPRLRHLYIYLKGLLQLLTKPILDLLLKFHEANYNMWDVISTKNAEFLQDADFIRGYEAAQTQEYLHNFDAWKIYINQWAAQHAMQLAGDFVECGVYRGRIAMSNMVATHFEAFPDRRYYLLDTFEGLDRALSTERELTQYKFAYPESYQFVKKSFQRYSNVRIIKGSVPSTLAQVDTDRVAYLSIDMNTVLPEIKALEFFWAKLVPGAIVVLDDYAQMCHEHQKHAMDRFAASMGIKILSLPTGQGILIKF